MKMMKMMMMNAGSRPSSATHVSNTGARVSNPCMGVSKTSVRVSNTRMGVSTLVLVCLTRWWWHSLGQAGSRPLSVYLHMFLSLSLSRVRALSLLPPLFDISSL